MRTHAPNRITPTKLATKNQENRFTLQSSHRVTFPLPRRLGVAPDPLEQASKCLLAVVAVRKKNHARLLLRKADQVILRPVPMTLLEEGRPESCLLKQAP